MVIVSFTVVSGIEQGDSNELFSQIDDFLRTGGVGREIIPQVDQVSSTAAIYNPENRGFTSFYQVEYEEQLAKASIGKENWRRFVIKSGILRLDLNISSEERTLILDFERRSGLNPVSTDIFPMLSMWLPSVLYLERVDSRKILESAMGVISYNRSSETKSFIFSDKKQVIAFQEQIEENPKIQEVEVRSRLVSPSFSPFVITMNKRRSISDIARLKLGLLPWQMWNADLVSWCLEQSIVADEDGIAQHNTEAIARIINSIRFDIQNIDNLAE